MRLELDAWREACGPADLQASVNHLMTLLADRLPVALLLVRRLDLETRRLETAAFARLGTVAGPARARTDLGPEAFDALLSWCLGGGVRKIAGPVEDWLRATLPEGLAGAALAGPLAGGGRPAGVVVLVARAGKAFSTADEALVAELLAPLAAALEKDRVFHQLSRLKEAALANQRAALQPQDITDSIIGAQTGLRAVMERVELVAHTDAPVLIFGETGSGKEVVARAIHTRSRRGAGPVLRVNCGAIPPELIDSELFGHERGSFTGAVGTRKGWFERADGGTLFLDEIGELPLAAQVRLLRILQDGTFERVGGQVPLTVDVRIVAATHRDLRAMVRAGTFRQDLWYRIGVFPIDLPPLRERSEDIPQLAALFAERAGRRLGAAPLLPTADDVDLLLRYDWPGNVRELAAVIERAAILGNGRHLDLRAALGNAVPDPALSSAPHVESLSIQNFPSLDQAMSRHIKAALALTRGRIEGPQGAAKLLDINPHTLRARMRGLGIDWARFREGGLG